MRELNIIPKTLPPRSHSEYYQRIPRTIWQTMKSNIVPVVMAEYAASWIDKNPEYEYRFFDDKDIYDFIKMDFPAYIKGYTAIRDGVVKADFWRYLIIYKFGGVYADIDCKCIVPLRNWINPDSGWVTQLGINRDVCQWLIISVANNPVFKRAANKSYKNILKSLDEGRKNFVSYRGFERDVNKKLSVSRHLYKMEHPILTIAGPPILQKAAEESFRDWTEARIFDSLQVVCVSDEKQSCQFDGAVRHDCGKDEYVEALRLLSTPHYRSYQKGNTFTVKALSKMCFNYALERLRLWRRFLSLK